MKTYILPLLALICSPVIAADYISSSSAGTLPNSNGQFVYSMSDTATSTEVDYQSTDSANSGSTKDGKFIFFSLNDCGVHCAPSEYISSFSTGNMPDMNGHFIYKSK